MLSLAAIGLLVGCVLGLTGAGGSILAVPLLMVLLKLPPSDAMGLALAVVAISALYGSVLQQRHVLWVPALILAVGGMLTAPAGKWSAALVPALWLQWGFAVLALIVAYSMFRQASTSAIMRSQPLSDAVPNGMPCRLSETGQFQLRYRCMSRLVWGGMGIGFVSGLFGVGGGFLIVPLLLYVSEISLATAVASSLVIITVVSATGFISYVAMGAALNPATLVPLLLAALLGMLMSNYIAQRIQASLVQKLCAGLLLLMTAISLL